MNSGERSGSVKYVKSAQPSNCDSCGKESHEVVEFYMACLDDEFVLCKECLSNAFGLACRVRVLSIGDYSDYRVVGLFDDCHAADGERIAGYVGGELEENPVRVNFVDVEEPPADKQFFHVQMYRNGNSVSTSPWSALDYWGSDKGKKIKKRVEGYYVYKEGSRIWRLHVDVYANDRDHAAKIANEIRAQVLTGALPEKGSLP